jgi:Swi5-dependent recombination DNA repair protein 1
MASCSKLTRNHRGKVTMATRLKRPLASDHPSCTARLTKPFRTPIKAKPDANSQQSQTQGTRAPDAHPDHADHADDLHRQYVALSRQLNQARQLLDTVQQATDILTNDQPAALTNLIDKWRAVVRDAADELFEHARERAQNDGTAMFQRRSTFEKSEDHFAHLSAEQKVMLQARQEDEHAVAVKYGLVESIEANTQPTEDTVSCSDVGTTPLNPLIHLQSFTMATMLRYMNVDLDLVGYDEKEQRWLT